MNVLKEVLKKDVNPALGCTEPIAVAFACAVARQAIKDYYSLNHVMVKEIIVTLSLGVYKNSFSVRIPKTKGGQGAAIAAALGAVGGDQTRGLNVLQPTTANHLALAKQLVSLGKVQVGFDASWNSLQIETRVVTEDGHVGQTVTKKGHLNIISVLVDGHSVPFVPVVGKSREIKCDPGILQDTLSKMTITDLLGLVAAMDEKDCRRIQRGINMNLKLSKAGLKVKNGVGFSLNALVEKGVLQDDLVTSTKILVARGTDARMAGVNMKAMSSGNSGNQGMVAILVPYQVGLRNGVDVRIIQQSIALSHLINSYVKSVTGELAPVCGCAIAAGLGAAAAIVFQQSQDVKMIGRAINIVIANLAGLLCDGAKGGCALKVVSAADCAITSAHQALVGYEVSGQDGILGQTPEQTIANLDQVMKGGLLNMDVTVVGIMRGKA